MKTVCSTTTPWTPSAYSTPSNTCTPTTRTPTTAPTSGRSSSTSGQTTSLWLHRWDNNNFYEKKNLIWIHFIGSSEEAGGGSRTKTRRIRDFCREIQSFPCRIRFTIRAFASIQCVTFQSHSRQSARLFLQSSELEPPPPPLAGNCVHPPLWFLRGTLACGRGGGRFLFGQRDRYCGNYMYLVPSIYFKKYSFP